MRHSDKHVEYLNKWSENQNNVKLQGITDGPRPDYPADRREGLIITDINNKITIVTLEPYRKNITQWHVEFNGESFGDPVGLTHVYEELARRNPPARHFY